MGEKNIAIITGASSGLGREFTKLLCEENEIDEIWAISRDEKKLNKLKETTQGNIKTIAMDLSNLANIIQLQEILSRAKYNIIFLINNAGYGKFCSYSDLSISESINMINLNCSGIVAMGLACLPYMKKGSHIINISSQASFQPLPYQNIYSSTKSFIRNYSRALNIELKEKGISVTSVCPGWLKTNFYNRANIGARKGTRKFVGMYSPKKVAYKAIQDAKKGKDISIYGLYVKVCNIASKLIPQKTMMKIWLMQQGLK